MASLSVTSVSVLPDFVRTAEDSGDATGEGGGAAWGGCSG